MEAEAGTLLVQFARAPVEGKVKTRMMPWLSASQACELHRELVLWTCETLLASGLGEVELAVAGDASDPIFEQCCAMGPVRFSRQRGSDLGERMYEAIRCGLQGHSKVLLVGSDCPEIDRSYLVRAVSALDKAPVVLGPAHDGGYVLIGARDIRRQLFQGIEWGSERVYAQTARIMRSEAMAWVELPALGDIDRPADLPQWYKLRDELARG